MLFSKPTTEQAPPAPPADRAARSQRSHRKEAELRGRIKQFTEAKLRAESESCEMEIEKARLAGEVVKAGPGHTWQRTRFDTLVAELEHRGNLVAELERQIGEAEEAIAALTPTPAQLQQRQEWQREFAALATERLRMDRENDELIDTLREALIERDTLTGAMAALARELDLELAYGGLDEARFSKLAASLPVGQISAVERWHNWFVVGGAGAGYAVLDAELMVRETLSSPGLHKFGERLRLREEEASELLRDDRPASKDAPAWHCLPPSIMPSADFEALAAEAEAEGVSVREKLAWRQHERAISRTPPAPRGDGSGGGGNRLGGR